MKNPLSKSYNEANDQQLIEQANGRSKDTLNELIVAHESFIYNVGWKFTNDKDKASDLAQLFPIRSLNNLISVPYGKYAFMEIEDNTSYSALAITFGWFIFYLTSIIYILNKRYLK